MSKRMIVVIGAAVLVVVVAGGVLFMLRQFGSTGMSNGPGMLYFYSPV